MKRKAEGEAEKKGIPYDKYVAENYPELLAPENNIDGGAASPTPPAAATPVPALAAEPAPASTPGLEQEPEMKKKKKGKKKKEKEAAAAAAAETEAAASVASAAKEDAAKPTKSQSVPEPEKKKTKKSKKKKEKEAAAAAAAAAAKEAEAAVEAAVAPSPPQSSGGATTYEWQNGDDKVDKMEARRAVLLTMNVGENPTLLEEWMQLTVERSQTDDQQVEEHIPSDPVETIAEEPEDEETPAAAASTTTAAKKKSGGFFGWLSSSSEAEKPEEEVPDHDNDEKGQPLNRIERLRRQAKRADNAKRRAARERKARENGETLEEPAAASAGADGAASAAAAGTAAGGGGAASVVGGADGDGDGAAPSAAWSCEFCKFQDTTFDAVVEHEKTCSSNPKVVAAAKAKADVTAAKASTEAKAKAEALAAATAAATALKAAAAAAAAAVEMDSSSEDEEDSDEDEEDTSSAATPKKDSAAHSGGGGGGGGVLSAEVIESLAALQTTVSSLSDQLKIVNEDLKAAQTEIAVFRLQANRRRTLATNTPAIYSWQRLEKDPLSTFLEALRAREGDLRKEADTGGLEPDAQAKWVSEWTLLQYALDAYDPVPGSAEFDANYTVVAKANGSGSGGGGGNGEGNGAEADGNGSAKGSPKSKTRPEGPCNMLFAVGGRIGTVEPVSRVTRYDALRETWVRVSPLATARSGLAVVALEGCLFAINGSSIKGESLSLVEKYVPRSDGWQPVASTGSPRSGLAATVLDGQLYIAGGASDTLFGSVVLSSAERYVTSPFPPIHFDDSSMTHDVNTNSPRPLRL